jgi:hypothetical protein
VWQHKQVFFNHFQTPFPLATPNTSPMLLSCYTPASVSEGEVQQLINIAVMLCRF